MSYLALKTSLQPYCAPFTLHFVDTLWSLLLVVLLYSFSVDTSVMDVKLYQRVQQVMVPMLMDTAKHLRF